MSKMAQLKVGLALMSKIEPILKIITQIKGIQTHGKQELISTDERFVAVYREYFDSETDAELFVKFVNHVYSLKKGQLPPVHILNVLFKALLPIMAPKEITGIQTHGKPDIKKTDDGKFAVVLKEIFTEKQDAINHLRDAKDVTSMRL